MTTPKQLDDVITRKQQGRVVMPQSPEETLALNLIEFAESFHLNADLNVPIAKPIQTRNVNFLLRNVAVVTTALVGLAALMMSVPPIRAIAQEIINGLFPRTTEQDVTFANDRLIFDSNDFATYPSISEAQAAVDFEIRLPDLQESLYVFNSAVLTIPRNAIQTSFDGSSTNSLRIIQQPLENAVEGVFWYSAEQNTISDNAQVVSIQVGDYSGELVQGDWITSPSDLPNTDTPIYTWNDAFPVYRLRWQDKTFLYEIKLVSLEESAAQEIVALARSMVE